ncbi:MAG: SgcJ/EcaC family oxidoreductase [Planctomycetes bacterium]|nr:SgcJ/EcaC family oxidoreductase [Planctomycetota bacterium]
MKKILQVSLFLTAIVGATNSLAQNASERAAIESAVVSYVKAYNAQDAKAIVSHWLPEGVYVSRLTGEQVSGHKALEQEFLALFEEDKGTHLEVSTESIDFVSPNVAIEHGNALVTHADKTTSKSNYSVVYVKREGRWLIDRISEETADHPDSHHAELQALEWMIGDWVDVIDDTKVTIECKWTKNKNFISRSFEISHGDQIESSGMQIIGWDAKKNHIRSWLFDSNCTVIEGVWTHSKERWIVQSVATLADGATGSATSVFRPIDDSSYGWQKINRVVDGQILPNLDEVIITRK